MKIKYESKFRSKLISLLYFVSSIVAITIYYYIGRDTYLTGMITAIAIILISDLLEKLEKDLKGDK
jgi:hypothetical protein